MIEKKDIIYIYIYIFLILYIYIIVISGDIIEKGISTIGV